MGDAPQSPLAKWELAALAAAGGAGGLAVVNRLIEMGAGEAYSVLDGDRSHYAWTHGDIYYTVRGSGAPIVLLHGIYTGASAFEYRRIFDQLAQRYRVFAPDLLGFGLSDRPPVVYSPMLYEELIADFVRQVVGGADHPARIIASSLSAAFTIRAAVERPGLFERLVLIEPTGIEELARANETLPRRLSRALLRSPVLGQGLYNLIASRLSIRTYLRSQVYADPNLASDDVVDYYYTSAHQRSARFAPASFISGTLNTPVTATYPLLQQPILLCWGKDARINPLQHASGFRQSNDRAELRVFDCGGLPQDEAAEEFVREVSAWMATPIPSPRRR